MDEVVDVGEAPCSTFGQLNFGIDAFEQSVVETAGLEVGQHAIPMFFYGFGEVLKGCQFGIVGPVAPKGEVAGSGFGIGDGIKVAEGFFQLVGETYFRMGLNDVVQFDGASDGEVLIAI